MEMSDLRSIVVNDVRIVRMIRRIILMVSFGWIERLQWNYLGHDRTRRHARTLSSCAI